MGSFRKNTLFCEVPFVATALRAVLRALRGSIPFPSYQTTQAAPTIPCRIPLVHQIPMTGQKTSHAVSAAAAGAEHSPASPTRIVGLVRLRRIASLRRGNRPGRRRGRPSVSPNCRAAKPAGVRAEPLPSSQSPP
jgi:hypothetical protein